jgi:VWFA-related protein
MRAHARRFPRPVGGHPRRGLSVVTLAVLLVAASVLAQAPPNDRPPRQLPPVTTEVVRVDVVVTEKGHPKEGLTARDFVVLEDGEPQAITQFEAFAPAPPPERAAGVASSAAPTGTSEPQTARRRPPPRYVVLAVDDIHIEFSGLVRTRKALGRFLERDLAPGDRTALVTTSGSVSQDFTEDVQVLQGALARLTVQERGVGRRLTAPYMTEYQAEQIMRGDPDALRVAVDEIRYERPFEPDPTNEARSVAREMFAESVHNARLTLETLDGLVRGLSSLPGRKIVVLASDGFLTGLVGEGRAAFDMRRIADASTRAGVAIYSLDTRGLVSMTAGRAASSRGPMFASSFGLREQLLAQSEHAVRDAMYALAADTGGFLYENSNDMGGGLRKILQDTETYYLIAYEPTNTRRDGAFRRIEVRVPGLRDARVRARKGYFATEEPKAGAAEAAADAGSPAGRQDSDLRAALMALAPLLEVPIEASADFVSVDGVVPMVVVSAHVDLRGVPFDEAGGRHRATVDLAGAVFDESGGVVGSLAPARAEMDLQDAGYEQALRRGLPYQQAVPVKPGRYRVRVAAREGGKGMLGTVTQWVDVPDLANGKLTPSGVFLFREGGASAASTATGDAVRLQEAQARRRFGLGETLYVQVYAYNPARDVSGATDLVAHTEIRRGDTLVGSTPPEPMPQRGAGAPPLPLTRSYRLHSFEPGEYEVHVVVTDRLADATVSGRAEFTVE